MRHSGRPAIPAALLNAVIRRIKVEQSQKNPKTGKSVPHITYIRRSHQGLHQPQLQISKDNATGGTRREP